MYSARCSCGIPFLLDAAEDFVGHFPFGWFGQYPAALAPEKELRMTETAKQTVKARMTDLHNNILYEAI